MTHRGRTLLSLILLALAACTPARKEVDGNIARRIKFDGNEGLFSGQNDLQLRREMQQDGSPFLVTWWPFLYWIEPSGLQPQVLQRDAFRLEIWYAHHGWFDARVYGWELVQIRRQTDTKAGVIDIWGKVDPGLPSHVREIELGLPPALDAILGRTVLREGALQRGAQFELEAVEQTRLRLLEELHDASRAYAAATSRVDAHPEAHAVDVAYDVTPGIVTAYGPITITGNDRIPSRRIEPYLPIREGEPYKLSELLDTRRRLFEMSTFSLVTVEPDLSDPTRKEVPIAIQLTEAKFRSLRFGGGAEYDFGVLRPRVSAEYRDVNVFNRLIQLEIDTNLGVAVLPTGDESGLGVEPTYLLEGTLTYPRIAGQRVALELNGGVTQDVQSGTWMYRQPEINLAAIWRPDRKLAIRIGPHVEWYRFLDLEQNLDAQQAARRLFGGETEFLNPYSLTALDQTITWDDRDDPIRTTRGWYLAGTFREAFRLFETGYAFGRLRGDVRAYTPLRFRSSSEDYPLILAGRLRATYMRGFDDRGVPYPELAFLGGPNSIRGFRANQVGPYDALCVYDTQAQDVVRPETGVVDDPVRHYYLPQGGRLAVEATAEVRYDWQWGLTLATFVDAGVLEREVGDIDLDDVRWSAGVGARYDTLIGPIRFDVSARPLFPEDQGPNAYINCEHAEDEEPRAYDLFSSFEGIRAGRDPRPPFALVFYIAIGEAL